MSLVLDDKRGENMKYEVLKDYVFDDIINFTFYKKVIFDYGSEERYFCLTVQDRDNGTDQSVLLDFICDSEEFEKKAETTIREYVLNDIASNIECIIRDLDIKNLKVDVNVFDYEISINDKSFKLFNEKLGIDDFEKLQNDITNYVETLNTKQQH